MKNALITILIFILKFSIYSQIPKEAVSMEDAEFDNYLQKNIIPIVKGKIKNFKGDISKINISYSIVTYFGFVKQVKKITTVDSNGNFELLLDCIAPYQQIWIHAGNKFHTVTLAHSELFLEIDWLKVTDDENYTSKYGVKYSGKDGELNTYYNNYIIHKKEIEKKSNAELSKIKNSNLEFKSFIIKYDSIYSILKEFDNKFIKQNNLKFSWLIENERMSDYYSGICEKHFLQKIIIEETLLNKLKRHKSYLVTNNGMRYYSYLYTYINTTGDFWDLEYKQLSYLNELVNSTSKNDSVLYKNRKNAVEEFKKEISEKANSGYFYSKLIKYFDSNFAANKADFMKLLEDDIENDKNKASIALKSLKTDWVKYILNEKYKKSEQKKYEIENFLTESKLPQTISILGEFIGELPFDSKLYIIKGGKGLDLLANLKTNFKEKALLIDFWATWCAPCIAEFPARKKLYLETADLPIEFVYLCTSKNSSIEKWKSKIIQYQLSGTHIFVDEKIEDELMDFFEANGFPSYRFIDTKGKYRPTAKIRGISTENLKKLIKIAN